jgi:hypothetical protein
MNSAKASRPFFSASSLAELVIILLAICASIDVVAIAVGCYQVTLFSQALTEQADLISNNDRLRIIGALQFVARFTALIVFLIWFYRAHRNLQALGIRRGRYSSPWTVLLFLVPILNLYYAYDLVKELWRQSSPDLGFSDAFLKQHAFTLEHYPSKTALVGLWWGCTIASVFAARISLTIISLPPSISDRMTGTWMDLISDALAVGASILLILIVRSTAARQEEKHRRLTLDAVTRKAIDLVVATEFSRAPQVRS